MTQLISTKKVNNPGLSATALKWIALTAMFLDHFAAVFLSDFIFRGQWNNMEVFRLFLENSANLGFYTLYSILRCLGRLSLPLYSFLIVEGFKHTKSRWKYALRLFVFALISEIPFDYGVYYKFCTFEKQNIFFTLLIGLLIIWGADAMERWEKIKEKKAIRVLLQTAVVVLGCIIAFYMRTDYGIAGVMVIAVMYFMQKGKKLQASVYGAVTVLFLFVMKAFHGTSMKITLLMAIIVLVVQLIGVFLPWKNASALIVSAVMLCSIEISEIYGLFAAWPVFYYSGEKGRSGKSLKWFFYFFYPVHLCFLILLRFLLGYRGIWL